MIDFKNKKIIITGASGGIGRSIVEKFVNLNGKVLATGTKTEKLENLKKDFPNINILKFDISEHLKIDEFIEKANDQLGGLDILINNAGIEDGFLLSDQTYEKYKKTIQVNLDAPFLCSKYALPLLKKSKSGRIIMISSIQGMRGYKGNISYNTAKGGLINMTRTLAVELADENILVNSVAPGFINTKMSIMKDGSLEWDTDWFKEVYLKYKKLPMGRYGHPDDVAGAVYFFCSEDSKYVTGQTLLVDGGVSVTF